MTKIIIAIILLIPFVSNAQSLPKKDILKKMKATEMVWAEYYGEEMVLAKIKRTKKWGLYSVYGAMDIEDFSFEEVIAPKFDSLSFFEPEARFQIVKQQDKYGVLLLPFEIQDAADRVNCKFDKIIHKNVNGQDYVLIKEGNKWGLIDWFDGFYIVDPIFDTPDEIPLVSMESWMVETFKLAKKSLDADLVIFDPNNGDGALKARNKKTKKWGMYQYFDDENSTELIPMVYDSLDFFPWNGNYTAVYKNGKIGFYLSYWAYEDETKESVACIYEDYKRFKNEDGTSILSVKKDGNWAWIDWLTGEPKSEFMYKTTDDLPNPTYVQKRWLE